jgi:hypothetical protein
MFGKYIIMIKMTVIGCKLFKKNKKKKKIYQKDNLRIVKTVFKISNRFWRNNKKESWVMVSIVKVWYLKSHAMMLKKKIEDSQQKALCHILIS